MSAPKIIPDDEHESFKDTSFAFGIGPDGKLNSLSPEEHAKEKMRTEAEAEAMNASIDEVYGGGEEDLDDISDLDD
jgi:6-phosphogluconolactonase/glucosamine-6-phosphate isomerase/deaminase